MTDVLKELVELHDKMAERAWSEIDYINFTNFVDHAIPALKSLLSQEAELRELLSAIDEMRKHKMTTYAGGGVAIRLHNLISNRTEP